MKFSLKLVAFIAAALVGCQKQDGASNAPSAAKAEPAASADPCNAFVEKVAAMGTKPAGPDQRKMFADVCGVVSKGARDCVLAASDKAGLDKCLDPEKEKIMGVAMRNHEAKQAQPSQAKLSKLGVVLDVTGAAEVTDGLGEKSQMFGTASTGTVIVSEVPARSKKTLDEARKNATSLLNGKNIQSGNLPTGYWLQFENTGSAGKNHFVEVQHTVDNRQIRCESTSDNAERAAAALTACKSLRSGA